MGADVNRADLFAQVDWLSDATHNHKPTAAALQLMIEAFDRAPFVAKSGALGINLHIDAGPGIMKLPSCRSETDIRATTLPPRLDHRPPDSVTDSVTFSCTYIEALEPHSIDRLLILDLRTDFRLTLLQPGGIRRAKHIAGLRKMSIFTTVEPTKTANGSSLTKLRTIP
jgi:hypothetical protein